MKDLRYVYDNIHDFYTDALNPTEDGNINDCKSHLKEDDPRFRGLGLEEILKSKYNYQKGLDDLKEIEIDVNLGGSSRAYKYDEFDGDDLNYDRLLEGFPPMRKRIKTYGIGSGRLVNIYVVISENCCIGAEEMVNKAYTAIQIVDMLEAMGYRVAVWSCDSTDDPSGSFRGESGVHYQLEVCLKRHEDTLNKGLILNGISPWFFRYFMFAHQKGHYINGWGMGHSVEMKLEQTKENIVINNGQCLNKISADRKIKEIEQLFKAEQYLYAMNSSYVISHIVMKCKKWQV